MILCLKANVGDHRYIFSSFEIKTSGAKADLLVATVAVNQ